MPINAVKFTVGSRWTIFAAGGMRTLLYPVMVVSMVAGTSIPTIAAPPAVDANALVRQMVARYQSIQTLSETSTADITIGSNPDYIQTTTLKYKRPNLLLLETRDPDQGTIVACCNSRLITFYSGKINSYMRHNAPRTLALTIGEVSKIAQRLIRIPQNQVLNPFSFLTATGMPTEAKSFRYIKTETIDGHRAALMTARADLNWLKAVFPSTAQVNFQKRDIALWIDLDSKLLVRATCYLTWQMVTEQGVVPGSFRFVETHHDVKPDVSLRDEEFDFLLPKGAQERF